MESLSVYACYLYDGEGRYRKLSQVSLYPMSSEDNFTKIEKKCFYRLEDKWFERGRVPIGFQDTTEGLVEIKDQDILDQLEVIYLNRARDFVND